MIRDHGYPFPGIAKQLDDLKYSREVVVLQCDRFEVEQLLGDLARSSNDCEDDVLQLRLNALYEEIAADAGMW